MEKEHQPDSMSTVTMKPEYPPSEVYSTSEPPPAYRHPKSTSVQIARIAAFTIILSSVVLGSFILAASYVQARAGCQELQQLDALLDKEMALEAREMQNEEIPRRFSAPQALQQELPLADSLKKEDPLNAEETRNKDDDKMQSLDSASQDNSQSSDADSSESSDSDSSDSSEDTSDESGKIKFQLPLPLDMDEIVGAILGKNQKSRMNCVVEKRRAEELVDHQARDLQLPFGLNLKTPPRLEKVTGEKMVIICESGDEQRVPENVEILRGFPLPLAGPMSLPLRFPVPMAPYRPPMPAQYMQAPSPQASQDYQANSDSSEEGNTPNILQILASKLGLPNRVMFIKEQVVPPQEIRQFPMFIREQNTNSINEHEPNQPQQVHFQIREEEPKPDFEYKEEAEPQIPLPIREMIGQHIRDQLMRQQQLRQQQIREQMAQEQQNAYQARAQTPFQPMEQIRPPFLREQQEQTQAPRLPFQMALIPREVRIHIQRVQLPQIDSDEVPQDSHSSQEQQTDEPDDALPITAEELQAVHHAVQAAEKDQEKEEKAQQEAQVQEQRIVEARNSMMERQAMERSRPVDIPVPMMVREAETPVQDSERPHYVQPRSVRYE